ncbi:MAG: MotA/TolQ/ExbB proton channel family protein [Planctomycetota bacterium]
MEVLLDSQVAHFLRGAVDFWRSGGWAMLAIAALAVVMFGMGIHVYLRLWATRFRAVSETDWRFWIDHPADREGPIGEMLDYVGDAESVAESASRFAEVRASEVRPFERDLMVMRICVSAAPLVGLLGTVMGMLATFGALSSGSGGDKTMGAIAGGISEALVTTETGLAIALPGLFFQYLLARRLQHYKAFLAHLETVCTQALYRRLQRAGLAA